MTDYGVVEGLAVGETVAAFSRAFAAFAVACCKRSESDFNRAASGVDCGLAVVSTLSEREQPVVTRTPAAKSTSKIFFMKQPTRLALKRNR